MKIAQLCKSTCYNQLQQSIYLCHRRNMSQVLQVKSLAVIFGSGETVQR